MNNDIDIPIESQFLEPCDIEEVKPKSFYMIIFGGTGDLSKRKLLPSLFNLYKLDLINETFFIISIGRRSMSDEGYRDFVKDALVKFIGDSFNEKDWNIFSKHIFYVSADVTKANDYDKLSSRVKNFLKQKKINSLIYYLAISPVLMPEVVKNLSKCGMCREKYNTKVVIEKPFGQDEKTAKKLNHHVLKAFDERQIYRIDHYLGKETVQNILFFRFANSIFEPVWNRNYVDHIQITVSESIGVENRAEFYEKTGVMRDIIQNHMMQLIAMITKEPPVGFETDLVRDEKVKVFHAMRFMEENYIKNNTVFGQYDRGRIKNVEVNSYRDEKGVAKDSKSPTYFAGKFYVDNWRFANVPIYVRAGKRLSKKTTYIVIEFKRPPLKLLGRVCDVIEPNRLIIRIQPQEAISLRLSVKYPGTINRSYPVNMVFNYSKLFKIKPVSAYERLLLDCMKGDQTLFARQDEVEAMWGIVDPIISYYEESKIEPYKYKSGSFGPKEADVLIKKDKRIWQNV